jgi:DNA-binding NarL/FixJ family response regulator
MAAAIKILLADDHPVYRDGLRQILASEKDFILVHETDNASDALVHARRLKPDVLLLDVDMPGGGGNPQSNPCRGRRQALY